MPEIPIDLSKILFIISANDINNIDKALLDRMNIINIDGYNLEEKIIIVENFIIPKILSRLLLNNKNIIFNRELIKYLIIKTDDTDGLRKIEKLLDQIYDRIMLLKNCSNINFSFDINKQIIFPYKITQIDLDILIK
jgi:ATP-dependent Lon protease